MNDSAGDGLMVVTLGKASKCDEQTAQELEANSINPRLAKAETVIRKRLCDDIC